MPILHSAEKRMRADRKRRAKNLRIASELKTISRKFEALIKNGEVTQARELFQTFVKRLDQAANKKIIHRNTASRKKARMARRLGALPASR